MIGTTWRSRAGFCRIPPFGDYFVDRVSLCYEKALR